MKLIMTGLDHKRANLDIREKFAFTKEKTGQILTNLRNSGNVSGCVIISTCNRTEIYVSIMEDIFDFTMIGEDFVEYKHLFVQKVNKEAIEHLCRVASGLYSQIMGDDQIITQVREALELSRLYDCTDSFIETMFNTAIQAAKVIKTNVILKTIGADSVPAKTTQKLKTICDISGLNAVIIGNGKMGRLVSECLIRENVNVTVTLREYKKGVIQVPAHANTIAYSERYRVIEQADIVISATSSPHFTLCYNRLSELLRIPEIIIDLAVPRDVEPRVNEIPDITLLTIDEISGKSRVLPHESVLMIDRIIEEHIEKYNRWFKFKFKNVLQGVQKV